MRIVEPNNMPDIISTFSVDVYHRNGSVVTFQMIDELETKCNLKMKKS